MPAKPTWHAGRRHRGQGRRRRSPGMKGICLRGQPGWGQVFAPLTTVVNTFGGTWFDEGLDAAGQRAGVQATATNFYVDLVHAHGENGAPQAGFTECLNNLVQGKVAMWYDATSAAGLARGRRTPRSRARSATSPAPVVKTEELRLALRLGLGHPEGQQEEGQRLEVHLLGLRARTTRSSSASKLGWSTVPPASGPRPTRTPSTSRWPRRSPSRPRPPSSHADPENPGVQPRPALGIQFVDIPEFPDLGTQVSQDVSSAIAGQMTRRRGPGQGPGARRGRRRALPGQGRQ